MSNNRQGDEDALMPDGPEGAAARTVVVPATEAPSALPHAHATEKVDEEFIGLPWAKLVEELKIVAIFIDATINPRDGGKGKGKGKKSNKEKGKEKVEESEGEEREKDKGKEKIEAPSSSKKGGKGKGKSEANANKWRIQLRCVLVSEQDCDGVVLVFTLPANSSLAMPNELQAQGKVSFSKMCNATWFEYPMFELAGEGKIMRARTRGSMFPQPDNKGEGHFNRYRVELVQLEAMVRDQKNDRTMILYGRDGNDVAQRIAACFTRVLVHPEVVVKLNGFDDWRFFNRMPPLQILFHKIPEWNTEPDAHVSLLLFLGKCDLNLDRVTKIALGEPPSTICLQIDGRFHVLVPPGVAANRRWMPAFPLLGTFDQIYAALRDAPLQDIMMQGAMVPVALAGHGDGLVDEIRNELRTRFAAFFNV